MLDGDEDMKSLMNRLRISMFAQLVIIYVTLVLFFLIYIYIKENKYLNYKIYNNYTQIEAKIVESLYDIDLISEKLVNRNKNLNPYDQELIDVLLLNHYPFDNYVLIENAEITYARKPVEIPINSEIINTLNNEGVFISQDLVTNQLLAVKYIDQDKQVIFFYNQEMYDLLAEYHTKIVSSASDLPENYFDKNSFKKIISIIKETDVVTFKKTKFYDCDYLLLTTINSNKILEDILNEMTLPLSYSLIIFSIIYLFFYYRLNQSINIPLDRFVKSIDDLEVIDSDAITLSSSELTYDEFVLIFNHLKRLIVYLKSTYENIITSLNNELKNAEKTNDAKTMFLANMSHEMRTPLNSICGYTQLLKRMGYDNKEKVQEYVECISTSSELLLQKINDILDLSKIESNEFCLNERPNDLAQIVKEVYDLLKVQTQNKNIEFSYNLDPNIPPCLSIDSTRLKQILINLISNAIKFTEKGQVTLEIEVFGYSNDYVILEYTISDTGVGISKDKIDNIFVPFFQACSNKYPNTGTGLGLTIARDLIKLMGGDINVQSKENVGTIFSFITKFKTCDVEKVENHNQELSNEYITELLKGKKILVVEDNVINQIFIKEIFSVYNKSDFDIANNGVEAVEMCKNKLYDIILMDVQMPVMDGVEATKIIKQMVSYQNVPIIALTATGFSEYIKQYLMDGMDDYLLKPLELKKFKNVLAKYLNKAN